MTDDDKVVDEAAASAADVPRSRSRLRALKRTRDSGGTGRVTPEKQSMACATLLRAVNKRISARIHMRASSAVAMLNGTITILDAVDEFDSHMMWNGIAEAITAASAAAAAALAPFEPPPSESIVTGSSVHSCTSDARQRKARTVRRRDGAPCRSLGTIDDEDPSAGHKHKSAPSQCGGSVMVISLCDVLRNSASVESLTWVSAASVAAADAGSPGGS